MELKHKRRLLTTMYARVTAARLTHEFQSLYCIVVVHFKKQVGSLVGFVNEKLIKEIELRSIQGNPKFMELKHR